MREIEFRAKILDNDEWVYGYYVQGMDFENKPINNSIVRNTTTINHVDKTIKQDIYKVDINTLGQYTGLKDKNGKKIFDGDIIKQAYGKFLNGKQRYIYYCIAYSEEDGCLRAFANGLTGYSFDICFARYVINEQDLEVVGNIWDNANLLKGEE